MNERMAEYGLTNKRLAALADIDVTLVSRLRNAQENPKLQTIMKVATALDLTLEEIGARERKLREADKKPPSPRL
jgi:transcriptional regulator with XRE-family HTH domain